MLLTEILTGKKKHIRIERVGNDDYKVLTKRRYFFSWKSFKAPTDVSVYKIQTQDDNDILGVMAIIDFPSEKRIEINLLSSSHENVGKSKIYDGIAGHLIAYACRIAVKQYGV